MSTVPMLAADVQPVTVYQAISAVQGAVAREGISKTRKNQQQGYAFRGIDDVYNSLSSLLARYGLCIIPRYLSRTVTEHQSRNGGVLFNVVVEAEFDLVGPDGSMHTARNYGEAMDSADKATNKAMSAAYKNMALQVFAIPTEGDNDADYRTPDPVKAKAAQQAIVNEALEREQQYQQLGSGDAPDPSTSMKLLEQRQTAKDTEAQTIVEQSKPKGKAKPTTKNFDMLGHFQEMKELLRKHSDGTDTIYYSILGGEGYEKSNQIPNDTEGRKVYKLMAQRLTELKSKSDVRGVFEHAREAIGPHPFMQMIVGYGCQNIDEVLKLPQPNFDKLVEQIKAAVDEKNGVRT